MADSVNFQCLQLEGRLPGRDFERQTEDVINSIGGCVVDLEISAARLETGVAAQSTADSAYSIAANNVRSLSTQPPR